MKSEEKNMLEQDSRFINRELSWLEFNERVLDEARDKQNPLLERVKFLGITCSNLDEFFMIRVASLKDMVHADYTKPDPAGLTPGMQLEAISERTHQMMSRQYSTFNRVLKPALKESKIIFKNRKELNREQEQYLETYFNTTVYPILTPMAVDAARPFPLISNQSLNICVEIEKMPADSGYDESGYAIVQVPSVLPRLVKLPDPDHKTFIFLEDIIRHFMKRLFHNVVIGGACCFRIMRNADLDIEEEEAADLLTEIKKQLKQRQWGEVIRLEIEEGFDKAMLRQISQAMGIDKLDIYTLNGPLDLTCLNQLCKLPDMDEHRYPPYEGQANPLLQDVDLFEAIRQKDILLHHPFEAFDPIIELVRRAAEDPNVLAIKQTLYRVSGQSPVIQYLAEAAERGKQVMVLVELKARFDEENNIQWARKLEQAGCHVIYGQVGLKTHSKITLVVRRDEDGIRRYVHLGTGNYNDITAQLYTDFGMLTCSESIGADASAFFNMLSGYSAPLTWHKLVPAPFWMRKEFERRILQEQRLAQAGRPARIIVKTNSLVDPAIIDCLYQASQAGVKIDLIVRGICCLRAGVPGLSENITVRSIIGRFLEHSRIYYFLNDGQEDLFLSSADWMPRNLDRRIELLFPLEDAQVRDRVMEVIDLQLADTMKARIMKPNGQYTRVDKRGKQAIDSQWALCAAAVKAAEQSAEETMAYRFQPILSPTTDAADDTTPEDMTIIRTAKEAHENDNKLLDEPDMEDD